jgi:hypothetical protein
MIFARDKSQMCNNLLQFAHVYAWGREHGRKVMSMRFSYKYPYFKITHSNLVSFPLYVIAKLLAAIKVLPTASFKHAECDPEELERMMMRHRHIVVSGWYVRYYELFLKYRHEICDIFTIDATYTEPVKEKMKPWQGTRLGVHIRRGDYAIWMNGIYCYEDSVYADFIHQFAALKPQDTIDVFLSTNDPEVSVEKMESLINNENGRIRLHLLGGNAVEDLYMLSACDYIIGPPSTYSLVAAMYRDIPLCRLDQVAHHQLRLSDFNTFDYWFRRIV